MTNVIDWELRAAGFGPAISMPHLTQSRITPGHIQSPTINVSAHTGGITYGLAPESVGHEVDFGVVPGLD